MVVTSYTGEMYLCTSQDIHFFDLLFYKHATVYLSMLWLYNDIGCANLKTLFQVLLIGHKLQLFLLLL